MGNSSSSAFPYTISTQEHSPTQTFPWAIHKGTRKSDNQEVTIFKLSKGSVNNPYVLQSATQHYSKAKTMIHPNVLRTHATLDTDEGTTSNLGDYMIVTEEVTPLRSYLDALSPSSTSVENSIAWGLYCLIQSLHFLHETAKASHGLVCFDSIFVTKGGDWKIGNFALLTSVEARGVSFHFRECDELVCPRAFRSPERVERRWDAITTPHGIDSYSLGVLIEQIYAHPNVPGDGSVPQILQKAVARLKTPNAKLRPRILPLTKCPLFVNNALVNSLIVLDEFAAKPAEEKVAFLQNLHDPIQKGGLYGHDVARYKLLPEILSSLSLILNDEKGVQAALTQDVTRRQVMATIPLLFLILEKYPLEDDRYFSEAITPVLTTLFQINDRGVRGALLNRVHLIIPHLQPNTLNNAVFEPMCSGFTDSAAPLRELTLKSALPLVPHLNVNNLEKLVRYLIRLQSDAEASIRTNTMIFIGKISPKLSKDARAKLILPAFTRGMKDEFLPCRSASLKTVLACREYFTLEEVAAKVLPAVVPHCIDSQLEVRKESMKVVDIFLAILKDGCRDMDPDHTFDGDSGAASHVEPTAATPSAPSSSSSYFSGLTSWMTSTAKPTEDLQIEQPTAATSMSSGYGSTMSSSYQSTPTTISTFQPTQNAYEAPATSGWDQEEDLLDFNDESPSTPTPSWAASTPVEDPFANIQLSTTSMSAKPRGKLIVPKTTGKTQQSKTYAEKKMEYEKRKATRINTASNDLKDGWDDF